MIEKLKRNKGMDTFTYLQNQIDQLIDVVNKLYDEQRITMNKSLEPAPQPAEKCLHRMGYMPHVVSGYCPWGSTPAVELTSAEKKRLLNVYNWAGDWSDEVDKSIFRKLGLEQSAADTFTLELTAEERESLISDLERLRFFGDREERMSILKKLRSSDE